jgi:hypothetical protein
MSSQYFHRLNYYYYYYYYCTYFNPYVFKDMAAEQNIWIRSTTGLIFCSFFTECHSDLLHSFKNASLAPHFLNLNITKYLCLDYDFFLPCNKDIFSSPRSYHPSVLLSFIQHLTFENTTSLVKQYKLVIRSYHVYTRNCPWKIRRGRIFIYVW